VRDARPGIEERAGALAQRQTVEALKLADVEERLSA